MGPSTCTHIISITTRNSDVFWSHQSPRNLRWIALSPDGRQTRRVGVLISRIGANHHINIRVLRQSWKLPVFPTRRQAISLILHPTVQWHIYVPSIRCRQCVEDQVDWRKYPCCSFGFHSHYLTYQLLERVLVLLQIRPDHRTPNIFHVSTVHDVVEKDSASTPLGNSGWTPGSIASGIRSRWHATHSLLTLMAPPGTSRPV
jgi:hypothetical protein